MIYEYIGGGNFLGIDYLYVVVENNLENKCIWRMWNTNGVCMFQNI